MARIAGVDLPREKRVEIGLTYIFGIGRAKSNEILKKSAISPDTRVRDLTDDEISKLRELIDKYVIESHRGEIFRNYLEAKELVSRGELQFTNDVKELRRMLEE